MSALSNTRQPRALVVEDEDQIREFLVDNLRCDEFSVSEADSIETARTRLRALRPDVVLLDLTLPDGSGLDLCRQIRRSQPGVDAFDPATSIVMLTARGEDMDRVRGLERGADDYLVKPFHYPELLLRVKRLLRQRRKDADVVEVVEAAGIRIDPAARDVQVNGRSVPLSNKEFDLLLQLATEPRRVFHRDELLEQVWGYRSRGTTRTLDSHASRLRKKLRPHSAGRDYIANVWGIGYRLVGNEPLARA